ncbi:MAG: M3 family metallopeptidase [Betaproteobacteria bacterium]|nr:M3 family metallopeptidase [Betaproteobacteria bacterium]
MNASLDPNLLANPLIAPWNTPYGLPPFADIRAGHFVPAFAHALREHRGEIDAIAQSVDAPTFENTVAAFDRSGRLLKRIESLFFNLTASATSPELQTVEREMAAPLAAHNNEIFMHDGLFKRVDAVHANRKELPLNAERLRLLERVHLDFVRAGARLSGVAQKRYAQVTERLAELTTLFSQNVLADEAKYQLVLENEDDLAGLPESLRAAAMQAGIERGINGHVITLSRSLIVPFLTFSTRRDLREIAFTAWIARGEGAISAEGEHDNLPVIREIMALRLEQAKLHGYACYADYALTDTMARTKEAVAELLKQVWSPAKARAAQEREAIQAFADAEHGSDWQKFKVQPWDWRYYAEKVRQVRYDLDDASVKPYFSLDRMVEAAFDCAHRLFGLTFAVKPEVKGYHPDVKVYEVRASDDRLIGVFLHDNFARATKRGGAWMSNFRLQSRHRDEPGGSITPIIVNNNNFAKGAPGQPALLSFDDARTLFHEFGHGLHGLLSNVHYERLSGTQVLRDFVELPSQIFEHWLSEPEVLKRHARHYLTGEAISDELVARLQTARRFNQGIESVEYTASALVDLAIHSLTNTDGLDAHAFELAALKEIGMPGDIVMRHRLPHFRHLFAGTSYSSQYYVYLWAEVLDADGYEAFVEAGDPFDPAVAQRLLQHIYSAGNTRDPAEAYRAFRGRAPSVMPMLKKKGLVEAPE